MFGALLGGQAPAANPNRRRPPSPASLIRNLSISPSRMSAAAGGVVAPGAVAAPAGGVAVAAGGAAAAAVVGGAAAAPPLAVLPAEGAAVLEGFVDCVAAPLRSATDLGGGTGVPGAGESLNIRLTGFMSDSIAC